MSGKASIENCRFQFCFPPRASTGGSRPESILLGFTGAPKFPSDFESDHEPSADQGSVVGALENSKNQELVVGAPENSENQGLVVGAPENRENQGLVVRAPVLVCLAKHRKTDAKFSIRGGGYTATQNSRKHIFGAFSGAWDVYFGAERFLTRRGDDLSNKKRPKWILPSRAVL